MTKHLHLKKVLATLLTIVAVLAGQQAFATITSPMSLTGNSALMNGQYYHVWKTEGFLGYHAQPRTQGSSYTFNGQNIDLQGDDVRITGTLNFTESNDFTDVTTGSTVTVEFYSTNFWFFNAEVKKLDGTSVSGCSYAASSDHSSITVTIPSGKTFGNIYLSYSFHPQMTESNTTISGIEATYIYQGSAIRPQPTVVYTNPNHSQTTLTLNTDYTLSYTNNNGPGIATVIITGAGEYAGTLTRTYTIRNIDLSDFNSLGNNTYEIANKDDLDHLALLVDVAANDCQGLTFKQTADITYSHGSSTTENNFTQIGGYFGGDKNFSGTYDGQNHTISGIRVYKDPTNNGNAYKNVALFGRISGATIQNVILTDARITGFRYIGGLVGNKASGTVQNCLVVGSTITCGNTYGGALFGSNSGTLTANHYRNCTVNNTTNATNVGVGNGSSSNDMAGARSVHTLSLGQNVTATGESVAYQGTTYYASNTQITLGYNNLPAGYTLTYTLNGTALSGNTFTMPANDNATVNATLTLITYNITYDLDGGSVATANPTTYNVTTPTFTLNNPTKAGFTFDGWTGSNGTTPQTTVTIAQGSTGDRSYTAHWTQYAFTLTLGTNITASGTVAFTLDGTDYYAPGTEITLAYSDNNPESQHIVFYVNGTPIANNGNTFAMPAANATVSVAFCYWPGSGTENDPFIISTTTELDLLAYAVRNIEYFSDGKYFKLGADIAYDPNVLNANGTNYTAIGYSRDGDYWFYGFFDGDGHTISGIRSHQGLFDIIDDDITVKNVTLADAVITGNDCIGGIVGNSSGHIENCRVINTVINGNNFVGGIVGWMEEGQIENCQVINAVINGNLAVGGIAGWMEEGQIESCQVINTDINGAQALGGIAGVSDLNTTLENCLALDTDITATHQADFSGAIVGGTYCTLTSNYYHGCTMNNETSGIGTENGDITENDGAMQVFSLSLSGNVTATPDPVVAYDGTDYYFAGTTITLVYGGTIPEGCSLVYSVNGNAIEGNSFEMPTQDVAVTLTKQGLRYTYNSSTGALALIWGDFNKNNKWGSEVTATAVTGVTATNDVSFTGNCYNLFYNFTNCTSMELGNVNTDALNNMYCMFWGCSSLTTLDLSGWNTANVTNMSYMFSRSTSLQSLNLSCWNTANVTNMCQMFQQCSSLQSLSLSGWNTAKVTYMSNMFQQCSSLQSLSLSGWNTSNVEDMSYMFRGCSGLQSLDLSGWNTANVTNMSDMFDGCSSLQSLDLTGWNTANVTNMSGMFYGCSGLTTIYAGEGWNTDNVWDMSDMFEDCTSLVGGMGTTYDADHTDGEYARIDRGQEQPGYFTEPFTKDIAGYEDNESGWYLIASPLAADIAPTAVTNMTNETFDLYCFDQTGGNNGKEWKNWKNEGGDGYHFNLEAGKGYLYANSGDVTLMFAGTPYDGDGVVNLTYSTDNPNATMHGWNLIGNPFSTNATIGDTPFYRMNAAGSEIIAADVNDNTVNPMEGIFVKATQANQTVTFETAMTRGNANSNSAALVMDISQNRGGVIDRAIVRFDEGQTLPKFQIRENSTKIYIPQDGTDYAVAVIASDSEAIQPTEHPIHFKAAENGTYTLTISPTLNSKLSTLNYLHLIEQPDGRRCGLAGLGWWRRKALRLYIHLHRQDDGL